MVDAVVEILAAFHPDVKAFLTEKGLIAPTVQWIFRRGQKSITTDEDYLSGKAHPSVFDPASLDTSAMIEIAHDLKVEDVPPLVRLRVTDESLGLVGRDVFLPVATETLFDTPSAIARVIDSTAYDKRLVINAGATVDPNGRPLTFRWVVLSGDADRIAIHPLDASGSSAEIVVPWHERHTLPWQPSITTDRVDIGVFASNGIHWSAPAFISLLYPGNEKRTYRADGQIAEVDYDDPDYRQRYVDPVLIPVRNWRDVYRLRRCRAAARMGPHSPKRYDTLHRRWPAGDRNRCPRPPGQGGGYQLPDTARKRRQD